MKASRAGALAAVLLGLLVIASATFLVGRSELEPNPSPFSTLPTGTAAFCELLRRDGFDVKVDRNPVPTPTRGALLIAPMLQDDRPIWEGKIVTDKLTEGIKKHLDSGGPLLTIGVSNDLLTAKFPRDPVEVRFPLGSDRVKKLTHGPALESTLTLDETESGYRLAANSGIDIAQFRSRRGATWAHVPDGALFVNRYLGKHDNAALAVDLVRFLSPRNRSVVVCTALAGDTLSPGLLGQLGNWAVTAQWQLVLLFLLAIVGLGSRLGPPLAIGAKTQGARQLVDAVAEVLLTAKKRRFCSQLIISEALQQLRASRRLAPATPVSEIVDTLDEETRDGFEKLTNEDSPLKSNQIPQVTQRVLAGIRRAGPSKIRP